MSDNDKLRFSDGNGALLLSNQRSASWKWIKPGRTEIHLESRDTALDGWCEQVEKAEGICIYWIEEGKVSPTFVEASR